MVLSSRMPGKRALNGASRAYVGFWFHCSPNPKTVRNEAQAQELINEGWLLLGLFDRQDGTDQYVEYHLGFPKEATQGQAGVFLPKRMRSDG